MKYTVTVKDEKSKKKIKGDSGTNLLTLLHKYNYNIESPCGGEGTCGKCKVVVLEGGPGLTVKEKDILNKKEISAGYRLACQIELINDMTVEIKDYGEIEVLTEGLISEVELDPAVRKTAVKIPGPSIEDQRDYLRSIIEDAGAGQIKQQVPSIELLHNLVELIGDRSGATGGRKVTKEDLIILTYYKDRIVQLEAGNSSLDTYGIAVDIGTTTIAIYLLDLIRGAEIDNYSLYNPQKRFGADVISRIYFAQKKDDGAEELQKVLIESINNAIDKLCMRNELCLDDILQVSFVGNTVMLHSLLGVRADSIARSPYIPVFTASQEFTADKLGLKINCQGIVSILPSVAGYVGADIVADLLAADFSEGWNLLLDIGTNGEIVLGNKDQLFACSAAAGPAFEGAKILYGMAGVPGAISYYNRRAGKPEYETIGNKKARGICGSGLVDIVACLLQEGFIENNGTFSSREKIKSQEHDLLVNYNGSSAYRVLTKEETALREDIILTQKDIREFQLARGAIAAGIQILIKEAGIKVEDINKVYLAGGFGNYIDPHNACTIGLIPGELEDKIIRIGNGAGTGAKMCLLDQKLILRAEELRNKVSYIELSSRADFQNEFMASMFFPAIRSN